MSEPYRILITGWRDWPEDCAYVVEQALFMAAYEAGRPVVVVHGECPYGGVDLYAQRWAEATSYQSTTHEPHPAGRSASGHILGPERNSLMVNLGADVCLAFPGPESRGTWDCVRKAVDADIPTQFIAWSSAFARTWREDADR